jgi:hypothetical protein
MHRNATRVASSHITLYVEHTPTCGMFLAYPRRSFFRGRTPYLRVTHSVIHAGRLTRSLAHCMRRARTSIQMMQHRLQEHPLFQAVHRNDLNSAKRAFKLYGASVVSSCTTNCIQPTDLASMASPLCLAACAGGQHHTLSSPHAGVPTTMHVGSALRCVVQSHVTHMVLTA